MYQELLGWTEEMAQSLRAFAALVEDPGSIPRTHTEAHNNLILHPVLQMLQLRFTGGSFV